MISKLKSFYKENEILFAKIVAKLDIAILILYGLFIFEAFLRSTTFELNWHPYYHFSLKVILILLVLSKSLFKFMDDIPTYFILGFCSIGFLLAYLQGNHGILLELILFTIAIKDIDFNKLITIFLTTVSASLIIVTIASQIGILNNLIFTQLGKGTRISFGIHYPTNYASYILFICLAWGFVRKERISPWEIIFMYLLSYGMYHYCGARTSTLCLIVFACLLLIYKLRCSYLKRKELRHPHKPVKAALPGWLSFLLGIVLPVCTAFSLITAYKYTDSSAFLTKLNSLFSGRLQIGRQTFDKFNVKLWGHNIKLHGNGGCTLAWMDNASGNNPGYNFIDSSYLSILFRYGLFVFVCVIILFTITSFVARKRKDYVTMFIIAIIGVHCIMEHHMLDFNYNPFIFLLISSYYAKKKQSTEAEPKTSDSYNTNNINTDTERNIAPKNHGFKPIVLATIFFIAISSLLLISDKKEPDRTTYDIAFPKADDTDSDLTKEEIEELVTYLPVDNTNAYTQILYTPKIVTGLELWFRAEENSTDSTYLLNIYYPEKDITYTQEFSTLDVNAEGYTSVVFEDFKLLEGKQYNITLVPMDATSVGLSAGIVADQATWAGGLYDYAGIVDGATLCFNLIYDYQNWGFINWMVLTLMYIFAIIIYAKKTFTTPMTIHQKLLIAATVILITILISGSVVLYGKFIA